MKQTIVSDLDGTIALDDGRAKKYLWGREPQHRDWDGYYSEVSSDLPNMSVIHLLRRMSLSGADIWILSGRRDDTRKETVEWLKNHMVPYSALIMREMGDRTQDNILKIEWAKKWLSPDQILFVLEDRDRMVQAWREYGVDCFQVRPGAF